MYTKYSKNEATEAALSLDCIIHNKVQDDKCIEILSPSVQTPDQYGTLFVYFMDLFSPAWFWYLSMAKARPSSSHGVLFIGYMNEKVLNGTASNNDIYNYIEVFPTSCCT